MEEKRLVIPRPVTSGGLREETGPDLLREAAEQCWPHIFRGANAVHNCPEAGEAPDCRVLHQQRGSSPASLTLAVPLHSPHALAD